MVLLSGLFRHDKNGFLPASVLMKIEENLRVSILGISLIDLEAVALFRYANLDYKLVVGFKQINNKQVPGIFGIKLSSDFVNEIEATSMVDALAERVNSLLLNKNKDGIEIEIINND